MGEDFEWKRYPDGWKIENDLVNRFSSSVPQIRELKEELLSATSSRMIDWIDHILVPQNWVNDEDMISSGFRQEDVEIGGLDLVKYSNNDSTLFPVFTIDRELGRLYLKVENIDNFASKWRSPENIEGPRWAPRRKFKVAEKNGLQLGAIERRGYNGYEIPTGDEEEYSSIVSRFIKRDRNGDKEEAFEELRTIISDGVGSIGKDRTADAFFYSERRNWESMNAIGRKQLERQDLLGLGWGNDDHHTFRCSREDFAETISILESIGMEPRERFYAGEQAGWGAQVLEQKTCNIAVFADVDLTPDEKDGDFAHKGLDTLDSLGTVGLWTGLHGESILSAGLHHIAALVDFKHMLNESPSYEIENMSPFSSFPYLKQCFTTGEHWSIEKGNIEGLHENGYIDGDQKERFSSRGALGSHLEYIERNDGFKGFNQTAVSDIISRTDPRK
jgi:hypothetical protein